MNSFIETLNQWGGNFLNFAGTMFWQTSLLIVVLFGLDFLCRRKIRASIRYALWLVVLLKLILPPTLALPTSPVWWLHKTAVAIQTKPQFQNFTVTYGSQPLPAIPKILAVFTPPKSKLTISAWLLLISIFVSAILLVWLLARWWQIARQVRRTIISERLTVLAKETQGFAGMKFKLNPRVRLTANALSPAVCGLFRPVILIPQTLADNFSDEQLRAVLLHELIHLRRRDVWVNFFQSLLQIFYWWQPLVWLANARIRRAREEAVDDAVMLALRGAAETYAPTLLEVARLALNRPINSLGLVGILESRSALRQRIERLINFNAPKKAGLTLVSILGVFVFSAIAVPMGGVPSSDEQLVRQRPSPNQITSRPPPNSAVLGRRAIAGIIHRVRLKKVGYDAVPLNVALDDLAENIAKNNPDKLTIPFENSPDLNSVTITINPPLTNVLAGDVLDAIVLVANRPIKYFIEEQGIEFSWKDQKLPTLYTRGFKINPEVFITNLRKQVEFGSVEYTSSGFSHWSNFSQIVSIALKKYFVKLGVDLESPQGKAVFYNDRLGQVFVKATLPDFDKIERAVQTLNQVAPQVHIKARFLEVPKGTLEGMKKIMVISNQTNQPAGMVGILTDKNFRTLLHTLEARKDVEMLAEPEVVTTTGRQTQMRATQVITVITNLAFQQNGDSAITPQTEQVETGPVFDTFPYVLSDGYTINLTAIASLTEFLGYDQAAGNKQVHDSSGKPVGIAIQPNFQTQQATAKLNLWDGQTLVMEKALPQSATDSKVPIIGDIPLIGHLFQNQTKTKPPKELIVFMTVTIVDPAGNRVHSDEAMPFTQTEFPTQSPFKF